MDEANRKACLAKAAAFRARAEQESEPAMKAVWMRDAARWQAFAEGSSKKP